jgi:hypothetical protein
MNRLTGVLFGAGRKVFSQPWHIVRLFCLTLIL